MSRTGGVRLAEDAAARERALDVTRSFLVQAPAGSGKTELLIQRLLALLRGVEAPERVLAITFTRKAAGEMRDRVIAALLAARRDVDESRLAGHELLTRRLAREVLAQDARRDWHLVENPSRLAIRTIDSLAQGIALQAPIASGLPPSPRFAENAMPIYLDAAHAAIAGAPADDPDWRTILEHQDNDADLLAHVLAQMLAQRDQWLTLARLGRGDVRAALERTLEAEVAGEIAQAAQAIRAADFTPVAGFAKLALPELDDANAELRAALEGCLARGVPPPIDVAHAAEWVALGSWVTTKNGKKLRSRAREMPGIPPIGSGPGADARRTLVHAVEAWLESLASVPGLFDALASVRALPPARLADDEWERIASMLSLLPALSGRLSDAFAESGELDFPQATLAALAALGDGDEPSELLLRLDMRVDHVLIDEFQDTSFAHLELVRRLVSGWSEGDGRTLFAVGDPMQSIYRFRGAEVRAFVEAQAAGVVEGIPVECLTLRRNFRSQAGLVGWVNETFPGVLGPIHDPWRSRVAFADAVAVVPESDGPACTLDVVDSDEEEAGRVVERVRDALDEPGNVALLVRARTHLAQVLPALRAAGIAYTAVDLDTLADRRSARDVVALAHAIAQPDDRLAWLAVLRAPWCGLALADLHALVLAADATPSRSIEAAAHAPPGALSPEGSARLARTVAVLARARDAHGIEPLSVRVRGAWTAIGGPATVDEPLDLVAVEDVLALLAAHERAGDVPDWNAFVARLGEERLSPPPGEQARVQVMTMHKAKGLEFDTVILSGLARGGGRGDAPLLRWRTRRGGLMAGFAKPRGGEHGGVYDYLRGLASDEDQAELGRLAYVACTRAKRRLALVGVLKAKDGKEGREWKSPGKGSILGLLDPRLPDAPDSGASGTDVAAPPGSVVERLPLDWRAPAAPEPLVVRAAPRAIAPALPFDWARERARRLGVVVHGLLAQIAVDGPPGWDAGRLAAQRPRIVAELVGEGALPSEAPREADDVRATVERVLGDERGRWLLDPGHAGAQSEWALAGFDGAEVVHVVLDRTFVAEGVRWIVDFKTGTHEGSDPSAFLDAEVERYRPQLARYARIVSALDPAPIRLALYHPRVPGGWREFAVPATNDDGR